MLQWVKNHTPLPLKRVAHKVALDPIGNLVSEIRVRKWVKAYRAGVATDRTFFEGIKDAWGNQAASADATYVEEVLSRVGKCTTGVLECGSGLTTLVAALVAERNGITIWSLEQKKYWARLVRRRLKQNGLKNVELRYAPLRDYGGYVWYETEGLDLPDHFELVVCDGPGVTKVWGDAYPMWRYGVLAVLKDLGVSVGEVLLDDATEPRGADLLKRWEDEFGMKHELVRATDGDFAVVRSPT